MELSGRLAAIADMITPGFVPVDVGCDHGYLLISLVQKGWIPRGIGVDIGSGPLAAAQEHVISAGLSDKIELRLGDGLQTVDAGEGESLVIAGLGGKTMLYILQDEKERADSFLEWVLEPQSDADEVRRYLYDSGYLILEEEMIRESDKFYPIMKVTSRDRVLDGVCSRLRLHRTDAQVLEKEDLNPEDYLYGPYLLRRRNRTAYAYLRQELGRYKGIYQELTRKGSEASEDRMREVKERLDLICRALDYYLNNVKPAETADISDETNEEELI